MKSVIKQSLVAAAIVVAGVASGQGGGICDVCVGGL